MELVVNQSIAKPDLLVSDFVSLRVSHQLMIWCYHQQNFEGYFEADKVNNL